MQRVAIADAEPTEFGDDAEVHALANSLDATDLALNRYRIPPGEGFPSGLHAHGDQEEVFVVLSGEATFETLDSEREDAREVAVGEGEAVRFAPGEYQTGRNGGDAELVALALGAPRETEDVRIPFHCPKCGHGYLRPDADDGGVTLDCPDCGAENVPQGCPDCGSEMRVALDESESADSDSPGTEIEAGTGARTVVVCHECGAEAATPFEA